MSESTFGRRRFLGLCGAGGASLLASKLLGCGGGSSPIDPDTLPDAGPPADDFAPPLLDGDVEGGVRVFRLNLQQGSVEWVPGSPTQTYGANGDFLGPTLRFRRGERVRVEVTNQLGEVSTVHWHGIELPARADGGPYVTIAPGATWVSEYDVTQRASTNWYHPHPMHETARQVYMGLAGLIYLEDPAQTFALPSTYGVDDLPLVVQDRRLFADGTHPYSPGKTLAMHDMMAGMRGETMLVNGRVQPIARAPRGLTRLRLLNGSNARIYNFGFADNRTFQQIASDGGLLEAPLAKTRVLLAPGERAEILVDFGGDAAGSRVELRSFSGEVFASLFRGMMGANLSDALDRGTFTVMAFEVAAEAPAPITPPAMFEPIPRRSTNVTRTRSIQLAMQMGGVFINGARMTQLGNVPAAINFQIAAGDTELWEVSNTSGMAHPLHVHNRAFQVLDIDGNPPPPELLGLKDTVIVPPASTVRLLLEFAGTPDAELPYMFHCHILEHEDMGMMGQFFIV